MKLRITLMALALACAPPAMAQQSGPLPGTIRSAALTQAQADELNRRLGVLQGRLTTLARETDARFERIRNIAVEIFGGDPELDFETFAALIENGARETQRILSESRGARETQWILGEDRGVLEADRRLKDLLSRTLAAADDGRLSEARALNAELVTLRRQVTAEQWARDSSARTEQRAAVNLSIAADIARGAGFAYAAADFLSAARDYGEAAALAPEGARERWWYREQQAGSLYERGLRFGEPDPLREAARLYRDEVLPLTPRASAPDDWAVTQNDLGNALSVLGARGDDVALAAAVSAYRAALEVVTRAAAPADWAATQNNLGAALRVLGERGDDAALADAISAYRAALEVRTRAAAPADWAETQNNLGAALFVLGERGDDAALADAVSALRAALEVFTRAAAPAHRAATQNSICYVLSYVGERAETAAEARQALAEGVQACEAALSVATLDSNPDLWASTQDSLARVHEIRGDRGAGASAYDLAIAHYRRALTIFTVTANPTQHADTAANLARVERKRSGIR